MDLRNIMRYGSIVKCYLAEDSKRITSSTFKVHIPCLMPSIEDIGKSKEEEVDFSNRLLNEDINIASYKVSLESFIEAKSIHNYTHRLDGWIPEFKTQTSSYKNMKSPDGKFSELSSKSSAGVTEMTDHAHPIKKPFSMKDVSFESLDANNLTITEEVHTNSTEVDFQELNRYFIKRGHPMYGCFIEGEQFEFVILFIDGATPYLDEVQDKGDGSNGDNPFVFKTINKEGDK